MFNKTGPSSNIIIIKKPVLNFPKSGPFILLLCQLLGHWAQYCRHKGENDYWSKTYANSPAGVKS